MDKKLAKRKETFYRILEMLEESLKKDISDKIVRDEILQRFNFTFGEASIVMKLYLEEFILNKELASKITTVDIIKYAFEHRIINNINIWQDMRLKRNTTVYTYDEDTTTTILMLIKEKYIIEFNALKNFLES